MTIRFFAQLKDVTRCDTVTWEPAAPVDAEQLWAELIGRFPGLASWRGSVRLARNQEYAAPGASFSAGDEVALIPPVSGG